MIRRLWEVLWVDPEKDVPSELYLDWPIAEAIQDWMIWVVMWVMHNGVLKFEQWRLATVCIWSESWDVPKWDLAIHNTIYFNIRDLPPCFYLIPESIQEQMWGLNVL